MRRMILTTVAAASLTAAAVAMPTKAEARCYGCWAGAAVLAGFIGSAIIANSAYGYYGPYYAPAYYYPPAYYGYGPYYYRPRIYRPYWRGYYRGYYRPYRGYYRAYHGPRRYGYHRRR
jgi:hypothetical protein